jgi:CheY-like chemotaxis protein
MDHTTKNVLDKVLSLIEKFEEEGKRLTVQGKLIMAEHIIDDIKSYCLGKFPNQPSTVAEQTNEVYNKKILLVDDDTPTLQVLQMALKKNGYHTNIESDPFVAFQMIEKSKPDLIILDLMMPQMTGFEFLQQIRSNPDYDNIKVVIGSSRSNKEDLAQIFKAGADEYLPKPFDLGKMNQIIEEVLELKLAE